MNNQDIINNVLIEYEKYKKFIHCKDMPNINVIPVSMGTEGDYLARASFHIPYDATYDIEVYKEVYVKFPQKMSPTLYHEFTHVYDLSHYGLHIEPQYRADYIQTYTEFHAVMIELMYMSGKSHINDFRKVSAYNPIIHIDPRIHNMTDHFKIRLNALQKAFEEATKYKNKQYAERAIDYMMYTLADSLFCVANISDYEYPVEKIVQIMPGYGDYIVDIMDLIIEGERISINTDVLDKFFHKRKDILRAMLT